VLKVINELRQVCDYDPVTKRSAKLERILELLLGISQLDEKAVVFSTLLEPLRLLHDSAATKRPSLSTVMLTGEMISEARNEAIMRFKTHADVVALLASSRVAGEGLTLIEANHVLFINQWWNPSANAQARDRVVRIGQQRSVRVYRFVTRGTIEQIVEDILDRKQQLFDSVVDELAGRPGDARALRALLREARNRPIS
jgi:SNF2 family DNA or RNA helicase